MLWNEAFLWRGWAAAMMMAVLASPIGCLMIWRRMAFFSDTLSHSALTGILLGIILGINQNIGVAILVCLVAFLISLVPRKLVVGIDILLLIIGQTALCIGIIGLSSLKNIRTDLMGYLFGDVLSVTPQDLMFIAIAGGFCAILLVVNWRKQVFTSLLPDIAQSEGVSPSKQSSVFMILTALFVALAMKTTGLLLVSALLLIPPATARFITKTPEQMALVGIGIGMFAVTTGLITSVKLDIPAAPSMEIICAFLFIIALLFSCNENDI